MRSKHLGNMGFSLIAICIVVLTIYLQQKLLINGDVLWLTEAASRLLAGGTYLTQFFENNPPLIMYIYAIPVLISKLLATHNSIILQWFIALLAFQSLFISDYLIRKSGCDDRIRKLILSILLISFFILPMQEYAQREHLLILLTIPYFFLMFCRLRNDSIESPLVWYIGIMAAIGFAIKPYFLVAWFLLEVNYLYSVGSFRRFFRPELFIISIFQISYFLFIYVFHYDYLSIVVPFSLRWCYSSVGVPWNYLTTYTPVIFCYITLFIGILDWIFNHNFQQKIWVLGLLGFLISYFLQQTIFFYHLYPALVFSLLIIAQWLGNNFANQSSLKLGRVNILISGVLLLFAFYKLKVTWVILLFHPLTFFSFFCSLYLMLLYLKGAGVKDILIATIILLLASGMAFMARSLPNYPLNTAFILLILFFGSMLIKPGSDKNKFFSLIVFTNAALLFAYPSILSFENFHNHAIKRQMLQPLIGYLTKNAAHKPIMILSADNYSGVIQAANAEHASRVSFLWMIPGLVKHHYLHPKNLDITLKDKDFIINLLAEDIKLNKPRMILVNSSPQKRYFYLINNKTLTYLNFDFVNYFLSNNSFKEVWKNYHYVTTLQTKSPFNDGNSYQFSVYMDKNNV